MGARALPGEVLAAPPPGGTASPWHARESTDVVAALAADLSHGLTGTEAARRLAVQGPNALIEAPRRGAWRILLAQFQNLMVAVLAGAALLAGVVGEPPDAIAIVAILLLNAGLGFFQEHRAEAAVAALRAMAAPRARVRRDGAVEAVESASLVTGDLVRLEAGDVVPADLRLVKAVQLRVAEATLTGEAEAVVKAIAPAPAEAPLGDRRCMAFKGTMVVQGRGWGLVVATGMATELGRIATLLEETKSGLTPLQKRLAQFTSRLALAVVALCVVLLALGLLRGVAPGLMFLTAVSLAVAAIPEALPAVVTVSLALGARRAAARKALIRHLPAVEALGSVTYICTDKTGTLTENRMRAAAVWTTGADERPLAERAEAERPRALLLALALSNDAEADAAGTVRGDPTEVALHDAAQALGFDKAALAHEFPRVAELPFTSERSSMSTLHRDGAQVVVYMKGAPERVVAACTRAWTPEAERPMDPAADGAERAGIMVAADAMAAQGMRVLAVATRTFADAPTGVTVGAPTGAHGELDAAQVERDLTFLGLVGLIDPPRPEAAAAVAECRAAGIKVVMVTGDHQETAQAIARAVGIVDGVHARVTPEQKLRIVEALQAEGEFVAMTGDGVNDAPALKRADIGVAMGKSGTDVAREAADLILLDDHFATIVAAVREGRRIYDNIRKFVRYALTCNSAEIWALVLAPMVGLPIPLLPIHILWVNLVTDGLPGIALGLEPVEEGTMTRPPRAPDENIFGRGLWQHTVWVGLLMGGTTLAMQALATERGWHWQGMTFTVLAFLQLGNLLAIRSEHAPGWVGLGRNPALVGAVLLTVALQLAVLYVPVLNRVFSTVPLSAAELGICFAFSSVGFIAVEIEKAVRRRRRS